MFQKTCTYDYSIRNYEFNKRYFIHNRYALSYTVCVLQSSLVLFASSAVIIYRVRVVTSEHHLGVFVEEVRLILATEVSPLCLYHNNLPEGQEAGIEGPCSPS